MPKSCPSVPSSREAECWFSVNVNLDDQKRSIDELSYESAVFTKLRAVDLQRVEQVGFNDEASFAPCDPTCFAT